MTSSEQRPGNSGRVRWVAILTVAVGGAVAAPLVSMRDDATSLLGMAIGVICGAAAWLATKRLRPWSRTSVSALFVAVAITFISSFGMKSLWLSVYGEPANGCVVTEKSSHTPRRSPTYFWNELSCGSLQVRYFPSAGYTAKPVGERIDLVIDRTGLAGYAEPDAIKPATSAVVGVAGLAGLGFIAAVLWWPARKPEKQADKPKLQRDFL